MKTNIANLHNIERTHTSALGIAIVVCVCVCAWGWIGISVVVLRLWPTVHYAAASFADNGLLFRLGLQFAFLALFNRWCNQSEEARSPKRQLQIFGAENKTLFIKILQQNSKKKKHLMFQLDCKTRNRQRTTTNCRFNSHSDPSLSIHRISPFRFSWPCLRWANTTYWFYCKLILCAPATPTIPHTYSRPVTDWLPAV